MLSELLCCVVSLLCAVSAVVITMLQEVQHPPCTLAQDLRFVIARILTVGYVFSIFHCEISKRINETNVNFLLLLRTIVRIHAQILFTVKLVLHCTRPLTLILSNVSSVTRYDGFNLPYIST